MMRMTNLTGRRPNKRPKVAVVYEDVTAGFRFADWFAQHGYQATLTPAVHQLERNLQETPSRCHRGRFFFMLPRHYTVPCRVSEPPVRKCRSLRWWISP